MSNNEIGKLQGPVFSANFTLAAGTLVGPLGNANARLTPNSKILGVSRLTVIGAGVVVDTPLSVAVSSGGSVASTLAGQSIITAWSALVADASVCTLYWCNESAVGVLVV